jgi:xylulokinase
MDVTTASATRTNEDVTLSIDVGTGSVRAAAIDGRGRILNIAAREHEQIVPAFGWAEQRPADWWSGVVTVVREVVRAAADDGRRIAAVCCCGQMHGTVLLDGEGRLCLDAVPLWNDKRTAGIVAEFERDNAPESYLAETGNPATPAWPGFKLAWLLEHRRDAYERAQIVLMPKDYINFRLTGETAMDTGDASCSFLMDPQTRQWSVAMAARLGVDARKLPAIRDPLDILGSVSRKAADETGLAEGTPVLVGGADYPVALLGSGVCRPGLASDVTGTSSIVTLITERPLLDPEICNVATIEGDWGPFVLLETGGDGMRWARRALGGGALGYDDIEASAAAAPAGADGLFFLPYLTGERLGRHRNSRAQFFGLGASHGPPHLNRAVMEGVAFAAARQLRIMEARAGHHLERVIASGGGAKSALWLTIKASIYGIPILVPEEPECGLVGCGAMAATAIGRFGRLSDAVATYVRHTGEIRPEPAWQERYARMQPFHNRLYAHSQALYDELDALAEQGD